MYQSRNSSNKELELHTFSSQEGNVKASPSSSTADSTAHRTSSLFMNKSDSYREIHSDMHHDDLSEGSSAPIEEDHYKAVIKHIDPPKQKCTGPLQILGVQDSSPIAWSADGTMLACVSGNSSIYILTKSEQHPDTFVISSTLSGHWQTVQALIFHPTEKILASAGIEGIFIWDVEAKKLVQKIDHTVEDAHENTVECLCYVYNGSTLISGSKDSYIKIWDALNNYKLMETIHGHKATVLALDFCEEIDLLASAGRDSAIKLWDVHTLHPDMRPKRAQDAGIKCQLHATFDGHRGDVTTLQWTQDGDMLFSGARDNEMKVWDRKTNKCLRSITGHRGDICQIVLLNKEKLMLSASGDGTVRLWELLQQQPIVDVTEMNNETRAAELLEKIVSGKEDPVLDLLKKQEETDKLIVSVKAHEEDVTAMEINKKFPFMATSTSYNAIRIWKIDNLTQPKLIHEIVGHRTATSAVQLLYDDRVLVSSSRDFFLHVYDVASVRRIARLPFSASVTCVCFDPTRALLYAGGTDYVIKGYSLDMKAPEAYKMMVRFVGHCGRVECIAVHPDGRLMVSAAHDFNIKMWSIRDRYTLGQNDAPTVESSVNTVDAHRGHILSMSFNQSGTLLVTGGADHAVGLWKVQGNKDLKLQVMNTDAHTSIVSSVCWGKGQNAGFFFSASWDGSLKMWSVNSPDSPLHSFQGHLHRINEISVGLDGNMMVSVSQDNTARVWSITEPYDCLAIYTAPKNELGLNCVSLGRGVFASGSENGLLRVWPLPKVEQFAKYFEDAPALEEVLPEVLTQKSDALAKVAGQTEAIAFENE